MREENTDLNEHEGRKAYITNPSLPALQGEDALLFRLLVLRVDATLRCQTCPCRPWLEPCQWRTWPTTENTADRPGGKK